MRNSVNVYVVLDRWAAWGDEAVAFITTDYDEIRAWAEEINYTYEDDYWVEEVLLSRSDVKAMAERLKRY
ncbi:hypothetical protein [Limosilactobacillus equigenerosi]|uniref:hypothetical protein n=2 Tax=Limosilactobacillus equigenerosi TaxID=417373 RepID=UPI0006D1BC4C|nr:hypothetical protein [Limosilactobacillus equigenerosi]